MKTKQVSPFWTTDSLNISCFWKKCSVHRKWKEWMQQCIHCYLQRTFCCSPAIASSFVHTWCFRPNWLLNFVHTLNFSHITFYFTEFSDSIVSFTNDSGVGLTEVYEWTGGDDCAADEWWLGAVFLCWLQLSICEWRETNLQWVQHVLLSSVTHLHTLVKKSLHAWVVTSLNRCHAEQVHTSFFKSNLLQAGPYHGFWVPMKLMSTFLTKCRAIAMLIEEKRKETLKTAKARYRVALKGLSPYLVVSADCQCCSGSGGRRRRRRREGGRPAGVTYWLHCTLQCHQWQLPT